MEYLITVLYPSSNSKHGISQSFEVTVKADGFKFQDQSIVFYNQEARDRNTVVVYPSQYTIIRKINKRD